jgi:hypothetical protein
MGVFWKICVPLIGSKSVLKLIKFDIFGGGKKRLAEESGPLYLVDSSKPKKQQRPRDGKYKKRKKESTQFLSRQSL